MPFEDLDKSKEFERPFKGLAKAVRGHLQEFETAFKLPLNGL
jgi:hypothetical protein